MEINLAGHELRSLPDGTRDEVRIDAAVNATLVQRVGSVTLNGDENLTWDTTNFRAEFKLELPSVPQTCGEGRILADSIPPRSTNHGEVGSGTYVITTWTHSVMVRIDGIDTLDAMKAHLAETPLTVLYPLATPVEIPLGTVELPTLFAPVANVWVSSDVLTECRMDYVRDVNLAVGRLEQQLAAVAGAVSMLDTPTVILERQE